MKRSLFVVWAAGNFGVANHDSVVYIRNMFEAQEVFQHTLNRLNSFKFQNLPIWHSTTRPFLLTVSCCGNGATARGCWISRVGGSTLGVAMFSRGPSPEETMCWQERNGKQSNCTLPCVRPFHSWLNLPWLKKKFIRRRLYYHHGHVLDSVEIGI